MGSRSRKRRRPGRPGPPPAPAPPPDARREEPDDALGRRYARGRERDEQIRAALEPLAPGERPTAVTVAAVLALLFAIANIVAAVLGSDLSSDRGDPVLFTAITTAILLVAAGGMLAARYWAVLGFQVILGLQIVVFALALTRVEKWWLGAALAVVIGLLGWLFWKLIRAMARLQLPERRPSNPSR